LNFVKHRSFVVLLSLLLMLSVVINSALFLIKSIAGHACSVVSRFICRQSTKSCSQGTGVGMWLCARSYLLWKIQVICC